MTPALHPALEVAITPGGLDGKGLNVAIPMAEGTDRPDRTDLFLAQGEKYASWTVPSLASLFRGNGVPPDMTEYPAAYVPVFFTIERHVVLFGGIGRVPTDVEVEEAYGNLRRRPDGRSLGPLHDTLWQASALALGLFALSEAEYVAVVSRLARSAKSRKQGPTSRAYYAAIRPLVK